MRLSLALLALALLALARAVAVAALAGAVAGAAFAVFGAGAVAGVSPQVSELIELVVFRPSGNSIRAVRKSESAKRTLDY